MGGTANCCTLASLAALIFLVLSPVRSVCKEETYKPLREAKSDACLGEDAALKRFDDIDYDSFVSLMGRRSAAPPNTQKNMEVPRKAGHMVQVLADLLGQRTRKACWRAQYLQEKGDGFVDDRGQRVQRTL